MKTKFWMIVREENGMQSPPARHYSIEQAKAEMERLIQKEKKGFYLLECVAYAEPEIAPIKWEPVTP